MAEELKALWRRVAEADRRQLLSVCPALLKFSERRALDGAPIAAAAAGGGGQGQGQGHRRRSTDFIIDLLLLPPIELLICDESGKKGAERGERGGKASDVIAMELKSNNAMSTSNNSAMRTSIDVEFESMRSLSSAGTNKRIMRYCYNIQSFVQYIVTQSLTVAAHM
jgi:hypothetical protein